jgi:hypothetical protein
MSFEIDLSNPTRVVEKMPELRRLHAEKVQQRVQLDEQIRLLARLTGSAAAADLVGLGSEPGLKPKRRRKAPAQERAVRALEAAGGLAMSPTSLYKFMLANGLDAPRDAGLLAVNLWDAWKAGRVMKAPNGVYTTLDGTGRTEWDRPLTDYYYAAELGMPTP